MDNDIVNLFKGVSNSGATKRKDGNNGNSRRSLMPSLAIGAAVVATAAIPMSPKRSRLDVKEFAKDDKSGGK